MRPDFEAVRHNRTGSPTRDTGSGCRLSPVGRSGTLRQAGSRTRRTVAARHCPNLSGGEIGTAGQWRVNWNTRKQARISGANRKQETGRGEIIRRGCPSPVGSWAARLMDGAPLRQIVGAVARRLSAHGSGAAGGCGAFPANLSEPVGRSGRRTVAHPCRACHRGDCGEIGTDGRRGS